MDKPPYGLTSPATLIRVIDGDTVVAKLRGIEVVVRLLNCWAPELHRGSDQQKTAGAAAKAFLTDRLRAGEAIDVHIPTGEGDRFAEVLTFGRVLGWVWRRGEAISLNEQLVQAGHATTEKPQ